MVLTSLAAREADWIVFAGTLVWRREESSILALLTSQYNFLSWNTLLSTPLPGKVHPASELSPMVQKSVSGRFT
jgi:hypothetical protein